MNEQIKKLAKQANDFASEYEFENGGDEFVIFKEKFAELIIRECIEGIKEWRDASDEHMDKEEYWKGYRSGCNDAIIEIIQRFGVEL